MATDSLIQETFFKKSVLPNGLRVVTAPMEHTRSVAISVYVGAGSRYETKDNAGISHFVEHMCFKGTAKRPSAQLISEAVDGVGGVLNAATDREYTVYYAKVATPHFDTALDVLADLVLEPLLDADEMEKERNVIIEELASVADSPAQQVDLLVDELLWPDQPLGWDIAGTRASVEAISRQGLQDYVRRQYAPNNMVVSVAGNVQETEVLEAIASRFGEPERSGVESWFAAQTDAVGVSDSVLYKRTEQTHICLGIRALPLKHPDRYALDLLSVLFGESMSSRLFMELRERLGLCYDVNSYVSHFLDSGSFGAYAAVDPANAVQSLDALMREFEKLPASITEEELTRARELAKGRMLLRLEDTRAVSSWFGGQEMLTGEILTPDEVVERLDAVTLADVSRVAEQLLSSGDLKLAIVGPHRSARRFLPLLRT